MSVEGPSKGSTSTTASDAPDPEAPAAPTGSPRNWFIANTVAIVTAAAPSGSSQREGEGATAASGGVSASTRALPSGRRSPGASARDPAMASPRGVARISTGISGGAASVATWVRVVACPPTITGFAPSTASRNVRPNAHTSSRGSGSAPATCSGLR